MPHTITMYLQPYRIVASAEHLEGSEYVIFIFLFKLVKYCKLLLFIIGFKKNITTN